MEEDEIFQPGTLILDSQYDLGDIKSTDSFAFEISNEGESDLIDVQLSTSNPAFAVTPDFIPLLRSRGSRSLIQNVRITALHGTSPTGIGSVALMPKGINESELLIEAKTVNLQGDTFRIQRKTTLLARALLIDVEFYDVDGHVELESFDRSVLSNNVAPWFVRGYEVTGPVRINNTGNVDLSVRVYKRRTDTNAAIYNESEFFLPVGQDTTIERNSSTAFRLDGSNTISDVERLPIQPDGYIYMFFD